MKKTYAYMMPQKPQFLLKLAEPKAIVTVQTYTIDLPQTAAEHVVERFRIRSYEDGVIDATTFHLAWYCRDCKSEHANFYSVMNELYKKSTFPFAEILRLLWQDSMQFKVNGHLHDSTQSMIEFAKFLRGLPDAPDPQDFFDEVYQHHVYSDGKAPVSEDHSLSLMATELPGVEVRVKSPCDKPCGDSGKVKTIYKIIVHLNDVHKWPRERVADWLDSVDDPEQGIDLAFNMPEKEKL